MAEIMIGVKKLAVPGLDLSAVASFPEAAQTVIAAHKLVYGIMVASKP